MSFANSFEDPVSHSNAGRTSITPSTLAIERVALERVGWWVRLLPDQRANAGKRRKRVRFSKESEERKGAATAEQQNTDALEILFAVGMPIYRVPSTPSGYHPTT